MTDSKALADASLKEKNYVKAIELYTQALQEAPTGSDATELRRSIIAGRSLVYLRVDDIYNALQDCDTALSAELTNAESPPDLTAKCHFRRAKARYCMTLYAEAREDYRAFEEFSKAAKQSISAADKQFLNEIMAALAGPKNRSERTKLIRAIQNRGIMLDNKWRRTFPKGPGNDTGFVFEDTTWFEEGKPRELSILFYLTLPRVQDPRTGRALNVAGCLPEHLQVKDVLGALVIAAGWDPDVMARKGETWGPDIVDQFAPSGRASAILITRNSRLLKVPLTTRIGEIWQRARWPRDGLQGRGFEDLRSTPRARPHEVDGAYFDRGHTINLIVSLNEDLQGIARHIETHLLAH